MAHVKGLKRAPLLGTESVPEWALQMAPDSAHEKETARECVRAQKKELQLVLEWVELMERKMEREKGVGKGQPMGVL